MRSLGFEPLALEDLAWWIQNDRKIALHIMKLVSAVLRDPFEGLGKPEPLKHEMHGYWARRIDKGNRLVYLVTDSQIKIVQCRYHYDR